MAKSILISLSNPIAPEHDGEFNDWFNDVHGPDVAELKGFRNMTRYRAVAQAVPSGEEPRYQYLALYELDDCETAVESLNEGAKHFSMTDKIDMAGALGIAFEQIFTTKVD